MKNYIIIILVAVSIFMGIAIKISLTKINDLNIKYSTSENNYKASVRKNLSYIITMDQLNCSVDSLDSKLRSFKDRAGIKDSKINSLMIIIDSLKKQDTIRFTDTIFVKDLKIDTIIGDK